MPCPPIGRGQQADGFGTSHSADIVDRTFDRAPVDVRVDELIEERLQFLRSKRAKRLEHPADKLHVLLLHRPRSIPQAQGSA